MAADSRAIVLYDGVCGLCNRLNQFLLKRDRFDRLRFASLQSGFAEAILKRYGLDPSDLDTVYVVIDEGKPNERVLARSDAILYVVQLLGGFWSIAFLGKILPRVLRDALYRIVATNRYRVFGKSDSCMLPEPRHRQKFIDV
ncbi:MAG TPA: DCC1-like thiol-disulfide oxidoreductase family protein [Pyrinomonadaceae bacterium]